MIPFSWMPQFWQECLHFVIYISSNSKDATPVSIMKHVICSNNDAYLDFCSVMKCLNHVLHSHHCMSCLQTINHIKLEKEHTHREHIYKIAQKTPQHFEGETTRMSVAITLWTYKIHRKCTHAHTCRTRNSITNISNSGYTGIEHSMTNEKSRIPKAGTISCTDNANPSTGLN